MPKTTDSLNKDLYRLLKVQGFDPVPKDSDGETTPVPDDADVIRFTFKQDGEEKGNAWITVDSNQDLKIYYNDDIMDKSDDTSSSLSFTKFLAQLKMWAQRRQLGFDIENQNHLASDMAQRSHMKKKESIAEGYYPMGKQASYSDAVPTVKIVLQHTRQVQEGEQRFRNVAKIFLENQQGERILCPSNKPGIAQIYARHLAEGGLPHDDRWGHIGSLVEEYNKMAGFVRATRNGQFNESAQQLVNEGINHYNSLRESLSKMRGHRGYQAYFESYTPALMETDGDETNINELFVQETMDPRIESVMPILSRLHKKVNEMSEVKELDEWASGLIEGDGGQEALNPIGIPESEDLDEAAVVDVHDEDDFKERMKNLQKQQMTMRKDPTHMIARVKQELIRKAKEKGIDTSRYELEEDLGPEQKAAGQLGPTEKVKNNNIGKLVGANESVEQGVAEGQLDELSPGTLDSFRKKAREVSRTDSTPDDKKIKHVVGAQKADKKIMAKTGKYEVDEGKFTVNAKTGAKLDPRTGAEIPGSIKPPKISTPKLKAPAQPKLTINDVWRKVENVVSQIYPDGDPIDWLLPWFRKQGIADHKVGDILEKAARKNGYKDIYDYYNSFGDDLGLEEGQHEWMDDYVRQNIHKLKPQSDDGIYMGAKVYHREHQDGEPFKVVGIVDDQRVKVTDDYGNTKVMFIHQLVPAQGGEQINELSTDTVGSYYDKLLDKFIDKSDERQAAKKAGDKAQVKAIDKKTSLMGKGRDMAQARLKGTGHTVAEGQEDLDAILRIIRK